MKVIEQGYEILNISDKPLQSMELSARLCYKSEDKTTDDSAETLIRSLIKSGHDKILEFADITVKITTDRVCSHQLVRHSVGISILQESQRYCNYSKDKFGHNVVFINPILSATENDIIYLKENNTAYRLWENSCIKSELAYFDLLKTGIKAEMARLVLPNSTKTELIAKINFRALIHIFNLRCSPKAQPQIRALFIELRKEMQQLFPVIFGN